MSNADTPVTLPRVPCCVEVVATALRLCEGAYGVAFIFQDRKLRKPGILRVSWENVGKPGENHRKTMGNHRKTIGNHRKTMGNHRKNM